MSTNTLLYYIINLDSQTVQNKHKVQKKKKTVTITEYSYTYSIETLKICLKKYVEIFKT